MQMNLQIFLKARGLFMVYYIKPKKFGSTQNQNGKIAIVAKSFLTLKRGPNP